MRGRFVKTCPSCGAAHKMVKKCKSCHRLICKDCSINGLCIDCYMVEQKQEVYDEYADIKAKEIRILC